MKEKNTLRINDLTVKYEIKHRKVKYPRLEIKTDLLYIILPEGYDDPHTLVEKHELWIYNKLSRIINAKKESESRKLNLNRSDEEFKELIYWLVENISQEMDVKVNQVRFRRMKSRWGSCNNIGNINFNLYLKYLPQWLIEYIVFHEITHLQEMGHNKTFRNLISIRYPEYEEIEDELLIYWLLVKEFIGI